MSHVSHLTLHRHSVQVLLLAQKAKEQGLLFSLTIFSCNVQCHINK